MLTQEQVKKAKENRAAATNKALGTNYDAKSVATPRYTYVEDIDLTKVQDVTLNTVNREKQSDGTANPDFGKKFYTFVDEVGSTIRVAKHLVKNDQVKKGTYKLFAFALDNRPVYAMTDADTYGKADALID